MARPKKNSNSNSTATLAFEAKHDGLVARQTGGGERLRDGKRCRYGTPSAADRSVCP